MVASIAVPRQHRMYKDRNRDRYRMNKVRATQIGIAFELTYQEWLTWWKSTDHFHERGRRRGQYVMARIDRAGPYALGNIRCALAETVPAESVRARTIKLHALHRIGAQPFSTGDHKDVD